MISRQEEFKEERSKAIKSRDIQEIRKFAAKYGIKLPLNDEEVLEMADKAPVWE